MATKTATIEKTETVVQASTKVVEAIIAQVKLGVRVVSAKRHTAETVQNEAKRMGLTERKDITKMVAASWLEAHDINDKTPDADRKSAEQQYRPDVSKIMTLAYPEKKAATELEKAYAFNDKLKDAPKQQRIGENKLLEIARGNVSFAQIGAAKTPTKRTTDGLDSVSTKENRFSASASNICQIHKIGSKDRLTAQEAIALFTEAANAYVTAK